MIPLIKLVGALRHRRSRGKGRFPLWAVDEFGSHLVL